MAAALLALLLAQDEAPQPPGPDDWPLPAQVDEPKPLVVPAPDGPVPDGVPKAVEPQPLPPPRGRPTDERRAALLAERQEIYDTMPGYTAPTIVTALGGLLALFMGTAAGLGTEQAIRGRPSLEFVVSLPFAILGVAAFVFGLVWERERYLQREPFVARITDIDEELGW